MFENEAKGSGASARSARGARSVLLERGAVGLRVKDVAERAGLSPSSVLYYYPNLDDLLLDVSRDAMSRYAERRAEAVRAIDDPSAGFGSRSTLGVPTGPDDEESRLLYEIDALTGSSPLFATLSANFFDRQAMLYERILTQGADAGAVHAAWRPGDDGARTGRARGRARTPDRARTSLDRRRRPAEAILLAWAGAATGVDLRSVDCTPA